MLLGGHFGHEVSGFSHSAFSKQQLALGLCTEKHMRSNYSVTHQITIETPASESAGSHHASTFRASLRSFRSSFRDSRPPRIFSGLSRTSMLYVYGSNRTEKGLLMPATYFLSQQIKPYFNSVNTITLCKCNCQG